MRVFFTASFKGKENYQHIYDLILKTIDEAKDEIISLERQDYSYLIPKRLTKSLPKNELHYTWLKKGIKKANCVIIEASKDSFRLGHEATLALLYNKPVLCLSDKKDYSDAIINPKFYADKYKNESDVKDSVKKFLKTVRINHTSIRKNIYINSEYTNFLNWYGKKNNKNDSEVIRDLIKNLMDKNNDYENADIDELNVSSEFNEK
jgi:hypothetical protein